MNASLAVGLRPQVFADVEHHPPPALNQPQLLPVVSMDPSQQGQPGGAAAEAAGGSGSGGNGQQSGGDDGDEATEDDN